MRRYLGRKLVIYGLTFYVAVTLDWLIPRFMPGGPVQNMLSRIEPPARGDGADAGVVHPFLRDGPPHLAAVPQLLGGAAPR